MPKKSFTAKQSTVAPVRQAVIEFVGDRMVTKEELEEFFNKVDEETGADNAKCRRWYKRNGRYFESHGEKVRLSEFGRAVLAHTKVLSEEERGKRALKFREFRAFLEAVQPEDDGGQVHEAFSSDFVRDLLAKLKALNKGRISAITKHPMVKWDVLQESDFERIDSIRDAKKAIAKDDLFAVFMDSNNDPIGVAYGDWVRFGAPHPSEYGRGEFQFNTLTSLGTASAYALVVRNKSLYARDLQQQRTRAKADAVAFADAWSLQYENKRRYEKMLAQMRLDRASKGFDIQEALGQLVSHYSKVLSELAGNPDWDAVKAVSDGISDMLKQWAQYKEYEGRESGYDLYQKRLTAAIKALQEKVNRVEAANRMALAV